MNVTPVPQPLLSRLSALAEPARLRILALLEREELSVTELAEILQLPQSTVSRHLKPLAEEGWVVVRGEGTANFHRMADGDLPGASRRLWELAREEMAGWSALAHDRLRLTRVLAERRRGGRAFFAGVAAEWDRLRTELYGERFTAAALLALVPEEWTVADLGCGSGAVAAELAGSVARVVGVDASPEMLRAAASRTRGLGNVELRRGDLADLPIDGASCDAALLLLALTHVADPAAAVGEMARILRPGGRAVVVDLLRHDRESFRLRMGQLRSGFAPDDLESLLAEAGLAGVRVRPLPPEPQAKGPALLLATAHRSSPPNGPRARERKSR